MKPTIHDRVISDIKEEYRLTDSEYELNKDMIGKSMSYPMGVIRHSMSDLFSEAVKSLRIDKLTVLLAKLLNKANNIKGIR